MKKRTFKKIIGLLLSMVLLLMPCLNTTILAADEIAEAEANSESTAESFSFNDWGSPDGFIPNPDYVPSEEEMQNSRDNGTTATNPTESDGRLADGVYYIINAQNGKCMDANNGGATAGTEIVQWEYSPNINGNANEYNRNQLFKVTYLSTSNGYNYYSIRPMTNNSMGVSAPKNSSSDLVDMQSMSTTENISNIYQYQRWIIAQEGYYYTIQNTYVDGNVYLSSPDNSTNGSQLIMEDSLWLRSMWTFEAYTGPSIDGVVMTSYTLGVAKGSYFYYKASAYSSTIGRNGPVTFSVADIDGNATDIATVGSTTGYFRGLENGEVRLYAYYQYAPVWWYWIIDVQFEEGTYFLGNKYQDKHDMYMKSLGLSSGKVQLDTFNGSSSQQWELLYDVSSGYYKIKNNNSGLYLTINNGLLTQEIVELEYSSDLSERQLWKFTKMSNSSYKIQSKIYEATTFGLDVNSINGLSIIHNIYVESSSSWRIMPMEKCLDTPAIQQQTTMWCWATSAQMLARTVCPTDANNGDISVILSEQRKAVYYVFGDNTATSETYNWNTDPQGLKSHGGYYGDVAKAADFLVKQCGQDVTYSAYISPYDELTIRTFITDGYPIARLCGNVDLELSFENDEEYLAFLESKANDALEYGIGIDGHVTVIVGYEWDDIQNCYLYTVNDPATGAHENLTYEQLKYQVNGEQTRYWLPTVVTKTEYSGKTLLEELLGFDY